MSIKRVQVNLPAGVNRTEVLDALGEAFAGRMGFGDRKSALAEAREDQTEVGEWFSNFLPLYEGAAHSANRERMHNRAVWMVRRELLVSYKRQFQLGKQAAGSLRPLQANELQVIRRLVNNEMEFALNALLDCETGEYQMPLEQRGTLYGQALGEAFWAGFCYSDLSSGRYLRWRLSHGPAHGKRGEQGLPVENCPDCAWLAGEDRTQLAGELPAEALRGFGGRWGNGVYTAQELAAMAVFPQSGALICTTHCHCTLEDVDKPETPPRGGMVRSWTSLRVKVPTMLNRLTKQSQRKRLAELAEKWELEYQPRKRRKQGG